LFSTALCSGEPGLRLLRRRRGLRDHRNIRGLLHDKSDNGREFGLVSYGGGDGSFVSHPLGLFWK
jgi:hypothetical protein